MSRYLDRLVAGIQSLVDDVVGDSTPPPPDDRRAARQRVVANAVLGQERVPLRQGQRAAVVREREETSGQQLATRHTPPASTVQCVVGAGDTIAGISVRYGACGCAPNLTGPGVSIQELQRINHVAMIHPGMVLHIPSLSSQSSSDSAARVPGSVVRRGDSSGTPTSAVSDEALIVRDQAMFCTAQYQVRGELTVTSRVLVFEPNLDDPFVQEHGSVPYQVFESMSRIVRCDMLDNLDDTEIFGAVTIRAGSWRFLCLGLQPHEDEQIGRCIYFAVPAEKAEKIQEHTCRWSLAEMCGSSKRYGRSASVDEYPTFSIRLPLPPTETTTGTASATRSVVTYTQSRPADAPVGRMARRFSDTETGDGVVQNVFQQRMDAVRASKKASKSRRGRRRVRPEPRRPHRRVRSLSSERPGVVVVRHDGEKRPTSAPPDRHRVIAVPSVAPTFTPPVFPSESPAAAGAVDFTAQPLPRPHIPTDGAFSVDAFPKPRIMGAIPMEDTGWTPSGGLDVVVEAFGDDEDEWEALEAVPQAVARRKHIRMVDYKEKPALSDAELQQVREFLPPRFQQSDWRLLYTTVEHGISLQTLYMRCFEAAPTCIVVTDSDGYCFGAYATHPWRGRFNPTHYGSGESFLFTVRPRVAAFSWSRRNNYFQLSGKSFMALGGGGDGYGLWLDQELHRGSSRLCETYQNAVLSARPDFEVVRVEAWAMSAYAR